MSRAAGPRSQASLGADANIHRPEEFDAERSETCRVELRAVARRKLEHNLGEIDHGCKEEEEDREEEGGG